MKHERHALDLTSGSAPESTTEADATAVESVGESIPGLTFPEFEPEAKGDWDATRAWRVSALHAPIARAVAAVAAEHAPAGRDFRVLVVGGVRGAIEAILDGAPWGAAIASAPFDIRSVATLEESHPLDDGAFDCVAAIDLLPRLSPSRREGAVRELSRLARSAVVVAAPFDAPAAVAAARAVNSLYRASTGVDHPGLSRAIELGLPDLDTVCGWLATRFDNIATVAMESAAAWQMGESLVTLGVDAGAAPTEADVAASALFHDVESAGEGQAPFRTVVVASARPVVLASVSTGSARETALAAHAALRASYQQRAFERLDESVTTARARERDEFKDTVKSLAAELREREAMAEGLARQIRRLEHEAADLRLALANTEQHAYDVGVQDEKSQVHIRNLDAIIAELRAALANAERRALAAEEERYREEGARRRAEEARALAEHIHEQFISGRAGRTAKGYIELKRRLFRSRPRS